MSTPVTPVVRLDQLEESWPTYTWIVVLGSFVCFGSAWSIGANDVANAFATSVGAKTLTLMQACLVRSEGRRQRWRAGRVREGECKCVVVVDGCAQRHRCSCRPVRGTGFEGKTGLQG